MYTQNIPWIEPANSVKECQVKVPRIDYEDKAILKVGPHGGKKKWLDVSSLFGKDSTKKLVGIYWVYHQNLLLGGGDSNIFLVFSPRMFGEMIQLDLSIFVQPNWWKTTNSKAVFHIIQETGESVDSSWSMVWTSKKRTVSEDSTIRFMNPWTIHGSFSKFSGVKMDEDDLFVEFLKFFQPLPGSPRGCAKIEFFMGTPNCPAQKQMVWWMIGENVLAHANPDQWLGL